MTIESLQRVMLRLRKHCPNVSCPSNNELRRAIMYECGTSPVTYRNNRKALIDLGWIRSKGRKRIRLTNADLEES